MGPFGQQLLNTGINAANAAIGGGMGILFGKQQDRRQINQQQKLQDMQIKGQQQMVDYNYGKQMQIWKDTNYGAQVEQLDKAGLNPGLLYGMGGGGGTTTGQATGNVQGGNAPSGGGEPMAMGISMIQAQLMQAQKENIQADTKNKIAGTLKTNEEKTKLELENVINDLWVNRDTEGNLITDETKDHTRAAFKERAEHLKETEASKQFKIDENQRQQLLINPEVRKIKAQIDLMKSQGLNTEQMTKNLEKEGQIKQLELDWGKMGLTRESLTKFIQLLIIKAL